ncbi:MAG: OmpA family protein [Acidithiobacillus sp.]
MNNSLKSLVIISGLILLLPGSCFAEEKGQDLPFLHRYPGSSIYHYDHVRFDDANMPLGPFTEKAPTQSQLVQGELVYIYYKNPMDRSPLEIMSNYQQTLQQEGFKILWQCANDACIAKGYTSQVSFYTDPIWRGAGDNFGTYFGPGGGRMSTARLDSPNGSQTWVYLWVGSHNGPYAGKTYIYAVQTKPMQTGLVTADRELLTAAEMGSALAQQGRFAMHIHFDYNKATLRPDALPQVQQLAQTLRQHPNWTIGLDGHTDAVGSAEFNQRLSEDRARAVKAALVADGVPAQQIATRGLGATQPVADNSTDAGRAKNRRVEVVNLTPGFVPTAGTTGAGGAPAMATAGAGGVGSAPPIGGTVGQGSSQGSANQSVPAPVRQITDTATDAAQSELRYQVYRGVSNLVGGLFNH